MSMKTSYDRNKNNLRIPLMKKKTKRKKAIYELKKGGWMSSHAKNLLQTFSILRKFVRVMYINLRRGEQFNDYKDNVSYDSTVPFSLLVGVL